MFIRSLSGLLVPILATLLVLTTPLGTGQGVHANELLHPLLPHIHLIDGSLVFGPPAASPPEDLSAQPRSGPALGAGSGAEAAGLGSAIAPALPSMIASLPLELPARMIVPQMEIPTEFRERPELPPPTHFG